MNPNDNGKGTCHIHRIPLEDLFNDGVLFCESCFSTHYGEFMHTIKEVGMTNDGQLYVKVNVNGKNQVRQVGKYIEDLLADRPDDVIEILEKMFVKAITKEAI